MELHFNDLTEDAQQRLLNEKNLDKPEEANWDTIPLVEI